MKKWEKVNKNIDKSHITQVEIILLENLWKLENNWVG